MSLLSTEGLNSTILYGDLRNLVVIVESRLASRFSLNFSTMRVTAAATGMRVCTCEAKAVKGNPEQISDDSLAGLKLFFVFILIFF